MTIVKVKTKYQVTLPTEVREQVGLAVGDVLEARVEKGKITLTPKSIIDRRLAKALEDVSQGRVSPAFSSAKTATHYLHRQAKKLKPKE